MRLDRLFRSRPGRERSEPATAGAVATRTPLAEAEDLVSAGRLVDAIDQLAAVNRVERDAAIEIRLLGLRQEAANTIEPGPGRVPWPPEYTDPFPDVFGRLPEVCVDEVTTEIMGGAVAHHGALLVRNLIEADDASGLIEGMQRAKAERERDRGDAAPDVESCSWYRAYRGAHSSHTRPMVESRGGVWMADSPANTARILDLLASRGLIDAISQHFDERPCFSLQKSTLRYLPPEFTYAGWHQDGAFLGPGVRSMNVWVALTRCGGDHPTPGLDVIPRRFDEILPTDGPMVVNSVDPEQIARVAPETPPIQPEFAPGDGLLFDERFLHSTHFREDMTDERYALECWFFAPSHRSPAYLPFLA